MMGYRWSASLFAVACLSTIVAIAVTNKDTVTVTNEIITTNKVSLEVTFKVHDKERQTYTAIMKGTTTQGLNASTTEEYDASTANDNKQQSNELRKRVEQLTGDLTKAIASVAIAKQRQNQLSALERQKYGYVKAATEKVMKLVDNVQHIENGLTSSRKRPNREQLDLMFRPQSQSGHRLQVIHRLLAGAEAGLVHMESNRKLKLCNLSTKNYNEQDIKHHLHQQSSTSNQQEQ